MKITAELSAALAGRYVVEREIGRGGMAVVYLARDTKHDRLVAVKVLNPELGAMLGAERFLSEIKTTATLQHPNLLPLFDSGEAGGLLYYVMPYLEGESLRARLEREGQLPVEDAVRIATGIANALSYAHARGVIHRDLKPENVLLQHGQPVVLDFGIALAVRNAAEGRRTQTGISVGTPQYMSPEQAAGEKIIDARADIFALGALTYEMLAGEPPHTGPSAQAIIVKVMSGEVRPVTASRPSVPAHVASAVQRALARVPADRFSTAADYARALESPSVSREIATPAAASASVRRAPILPWAVAGLALAAALVLALRPQNSDTAIRGPLFASLDLEGVGLRGVGSSDFSVSPDGRHVVLTVEREDNVGLAVRPLDSLGVRYLPRTRDAGHPFWSPDSKSIGFFAEDSLRVIDLASGSVRSLCRAGGTHGGAWSSDGSILFSTGAGLVLTAAAGGQCEVRVRRVRDSGRPLRPYFFPNGRHFIATNDQRVWLGDLRGDSLVPLGDLVRAEAVLAPPDYLLRRGPDGVLAQRVDVGAKRLVGEPVRVLPPARNPGGHTAISASATGVLVRSALTPQGDSGIDAHDRRSVAIVDRRSAALELRPLPADVWTDLRVSRDGRRLSLGGWNVQAMDVASGRWTRVAGSAEGGRETSVQSLWSPGDTAVAFVQALSPPALRLASLRSGTVRTLATLPLRQLRSGGGGGFSDWSPDGRRIAFSHRTADGTVREAWEYDIVADTVRRLFDAPGRIGDLRYHPTGVWIAYHVSIDGTTNVFLRPHAGNGEPVRVSSSGGRWPRWSASGAELFYVDDEDNVVAVPVRLAASATPGAARVVVPVGTFGGRRLSEFDVSPDGERFFFTVRTDVRSLGLVLGWQALIR